MCAHISILEYYRNRLIRNSLSWTTLMRKLFGMEHQFCLHFVKNLRGKWTWPFAQPASLFFTPVTMSSTTSNVEYFHFWKKTPTKKPNPPKPEKICNSWKSLFLSSSVISVAFCQWFHFGNFSLLNQFLYVLLLLLLLLFFIYLFLKSFHISVSSLPPDGLFTRLGTYILQQDFQSCVRTSEEDDCFIPMTILNNGSSFTSSI